MHPLSHNPAASSSTFIFRVLTVACSDVRCRRAAKNSAANSLSKPLPMPTWFVFVDAEFRQLLAGFDFRLGEAAAIGLAGVLCLGKARAQLDGGVAVLLLGPRGHDGAAVEL